MLDVILLIDPPSSWVLDISGKMDARIRLIGCVPKPGGELEGLVEINLEDERDRDALLEEIINHPDVNDAKFFGETGGRITGSITLSRWMAYSIILHSRCFVSGARTRDTGGVEWHILVTDEERLAEMLNEMKKAGCSVSLLSKKRVDDARALTERQRHVLEVAVELGYFDYPRRINAKSLASKLGIAQSTLYETLQEAQKKLIGIYLVQGK